MAHPRRYDESNKLIARLRDLCLDFPAVVEKEAWGECTFRVAGGKMFAMTDCNHHNSGHLAVWIMAPPTVQETLIRSRPDVFFRPPYVGAKGWVGIVLNARTDWNELAGILWDGYRMCAPGASRRSKSNGSDTSKSGSRPRGPGPRAQTAARPAR